MFLLNNHLPSICSYVPGIVLGTELWQKMKEKKKFCSCDIYVLLDGNRQETKYWETQHGISDVSSRDVEQGRGVGYAPYVGLIVSFGRVKKDGRKGTM